MSRLIMVSSLLVLGVGCAGAGGAVRMGQHSSEPLLVSGSHLTGPSSSIKLMENGLRGRFRDRPVELRWDYQHVNGALATQPVHLELSEGDDTRVSGTFGGSPVDILMKQDVLVARVGQCAYYLQRSEGGYTGRRDCSGPLEEQFKVDFPEALQARPLGEMATLLTLALHSYTESYELNVSPARFTRPRDILGSGPQCAKVN